MSPNQLLTGGSSASSRFLPRVSAANQGRLTRLVRLGGPGRVTKWPGKNNNDAGREFAAFSGISFKYASDHVVVLSDVSAVSEANGTTVPVCLDPMSSLSIQPLTLVLYRKRTARQFRFASTP